MPEIGKHLWRPSRPESDRVDILGQIYLGFGLSSGRETPQVPGQLVPKGKRAQDGPTRTHPALPHQGSRMSSSGGIQKWLLCDFRSEKLIAFIDNNIKTLVNQKKPKQSVTKKKKGGFKDRFWYYIICAGSVMQFVFLTVQPQIIQLKNETTFENGKATLICEAEGEPIPEITWKRAIDGMTFSEGDKVNLPLIYEISQYASST